MYIRHIRCYLIFALNFKWKGYHSDIYCTNCTLNNTLYCLLHTKIHTIKCTLYTSHNKLCYSVLHPIMQWPLHSECFTLHLNRFFFCTWVTARVQGNQCSVLHPLQCSALSYHCIVGNCIPSVHCVALYHTKLLQQCVALYLTTSLQCVAMYLRAVFFLLYPIISYQFRMFDSIL